MKYISTEGNEDISITCANCGYKITEWSNIFEGDETSYICPSCEYEGYANKNNCKIKNDKKNKKSKGKWKYIGEVGVDSGQLMICDPCYVDSEWKREKFNDPTDFYFIFPDGKKEKVRHCSKRWFELIDRANSGEIKLQEKINPVKRAKNNFSYNAVSQATIAEQTAQLFYEMGHAGVGVAFRSGFGDGTYPVYAKVKDFGERGESDERVTEVKIIMIDEECEN